MLYGLFPGSGEGAAVRQKKGIPLRAQPRAGLMIHRTDDEGNLRPAGGIPIPKIGKQRTPEKRKGEQEKKADHKIIPYIASDKATVLLHSGSFLFS